MIYLYVQYTEKADKDDSCLQFTDIVEATNYVIKHILNDDRVDMWSISNMATNYDESEYLIVK
jgi:hypothetical protein